MCESFARFALNLQFRHAALRQFLNAHFQKAGHLLSDQSFFIVGKDQYGILEVLMVMFTIISLVLCF